eukprot:1456237-Pleurochrysis_carterae.AAC.1
MRLEAGARIRRLRASDMNCICNIARCLQTSKLCVQNTCFDTYPHCSAVRLIKMRAEVEAEASLLRQRERVAAEQRIYMRALEGNLERRLHTK